MDCYSTLKKRWTRDSKSGGKGTPMMMLGGHPQPSPKNLVCYACGMKGHRCTDRECAAGPGSVWHGAPESWKSKQRGNVGGGGGVPKRKREVPNGKGAKQTPSEQLCRNFNTGNVYCRFGANCKFKHAKQKNQGGLGNGQEKGLSRKNTASVAKNVGHQVFD